MYFCVGVCCGAYFGVFMCVLEFIVSVGSVWCGCFCLFFVFRVWCVLLFVVDWCGVYCGVVCVVVLVLFCCVFVLV